MPQTHLLISLLLTVVFYPVFGPVTLWILVGGVLIDVDHPLVYLARFKNFSLKKAVHYFESNKDLMPALFIFHTLEFLAIMVVLSFFYRPAVWFTIGMFVHYLADWFSEYRKSGKLLKPYSFFYWLRIRKSYKG